MWILTPFGFFSVVQKKGDSLLSIRARVYNDLQRLQDKYLNGNHPIKKGGHTDYPYRIFVSHRDWGKALTQMAEDIDYANFKRQVKAEQGAKRSQLYGQVWGTLYALQKECDEQ